MCLAYPGRIIEIRGDTAKVDFGGGVVREINISLVDAEEGHYVLVHAGFAIQVLDEEEAEKTLDYWRELLALQGEEA